VVFVNASFSIFCLLPLQKNWFYRFSLKQALTEVKDLLPVCQVSGNFTEGNARKFTVSFAFCAHVDVTKYPKTLTFSFQHAHYLSFRPQLACDHKTIGSHLKCVNKIDYK